MNRKEFAVFVGPSVLLMTALLVAPLVMTLKWSFQDVDYGSGGEWIGLANYSEALSSPRFLDAVWVTIGFTLVIVVGQLVIGYALALMLNRMTRGRSVLLGLLLVSFVVPTVVGALVFSWLFNDTFGGLVNYALSFVGLRIEWLTAPWPARSLVVMFALWHAIAFPVLIFLAGLQGVPVEHEEAADLDGASWWQKQYYVIIPTLGRFFTFVALIAVMDGLRIFDAIRMITPNARNVGTETIMVYVYDVALGQSQRLGLGSAISVLTVVATVIVLLPFIRQTYKDVSSQ
jgi:N,N'-diacetylchitobiose transport system permease protein